MEKEAKQLPGPGAYDYHKISLYSKRGASLDKSSKGSLINRSTQFVPGPGQYNQGSKKDLSRNDGPKFGFGTAERLSQT